MRSDERMALLVTQMSGACSLDSASNVIRATPRPVLKKLVAVSMRDTTTYQHRYRLIM